MTENEIKNAIRTINAKLEEALEREKETEGTEDTVIWHMVGNDYKCAIKALEEIQQYRAIGTVEECREARERQIPKKPNKRQVGTNILMSKIYYCPICDKKLYDCAIKKGKLDYVSPGSKKSKFCEDCGQAIDWSETV